MPLLVSQGAASLKNFGATTVTPRLIDSDFSNVVTAINAEPISVNSYISDESQNNFIIKPYGDVSPNPIHPFSDGYYSNYFDGTGDYLNAGSSVPAFGTSAYTVEFWVYPISLSSVHVYIRNSSTGGWQVYYDTTSGLGIASVGTAGFLFAGLGAVVANQWNHIAICRNSTASNDTRNFVNGVLKATGTDSTNWTVNNPLVIGANSSGTEAFNGYMSNIRIIKGTALYTAAFTPSTTPLTFVSGTTLLTCQNSRFVDNGPFNSAITKNGDVAVKPFHPFTPKTQYSPVSLSSYYSNYFDGNADAIAFSTLAASQAALGGSAAFTLEMWVYPVGSQGPLLGNASFSYAARWWQVIYSSTGIYFQIGDYGVSSAQAYTSTTLRQGVWTHVVVQRRADNTIDIYCNGIAQSVSNGLYGAYVGYNLTASTIARIGGNGTIAEANAYISDLRFTKDRVYTANFSVPTTPAVTLANTTLLTCQSSTIKDNSRFSFPLTIAGDTKVSSFNPYTTNPLTLVTDNPNIPKQYVPVSNTSYHSVYFDGSGDYLETPSSTAFAFGTGDWTMEAWVYLTSAADTCRIIKMSTDSDNIEVNAAGTWVLYYNGSSVASATSSAIVTNSWFHVAAVRSSGTVKVYINGLLTVTQASTPNTTSARICRIGGDGGGQPMAGYITNLRIVKGQALYTANFTPSISVLTATSQGSTAANVSLLTCQNSTIVDNSNNAFTIGIGGDAKPSTFSVYTSPSYTPATIDKTTYGSAYFDGTGDYLSIPANDAFNLTGDFTVECWVYFVSLTPGDDDGWAGPTILSMANGGTNLTLETYLSINLSRPSQNATPNGWNFSGGGGSVPSYGQVAINSTSITPVTGTWYHIAFTRSGTAIKAFINGALLGSTTSAVTFGSSTIPVKVGRFDYTYTRTLNGYISNLRIIKGTALYKGNFIPPIEPLTLTANTSLLTLKTNRPINNTSVLDSSPFLSTATRTGNSRTGSFNPYGERWSGYFGSSNYIYAASNAAFAPGTGDFTIEAWVYPTAAYTTYNYVLGVAVNGGLVFYVTGGNLVVRAYNVADQLSSATIPSLNTWTHVAASRSGKTLRIFVNGTQTATTTNSYNFVQGAAYIGNDSTNAAPWYGYISSFRFVKGQALYTANFTPSTTPLTTTSQGSTAANVSLLTCQTNRFVDKSLNNFTITQVGGPAITKFSPFKNTKFKAQSSNIQKWTNTDYGTSVYFTGGSNFYQVPSSPAIQFDTGNFTIEAWMYPVSFGNGMTMFIIWNNGGAGSARFGLNISASGISVDSTSGLALTFNGASSTILANTWNHVAITRSGGTFTTWLNGTIVSTALSTSTFSPYGSTYPLYIGGYPDGYTTGYGYISDFRIIKGNVLYTSNFTPTAVPLSKNQENTSFQLNPLPSIIDYAMVNNFETVGNARVVTSMSAKDTNYSVYFDGSGDYLTVSSTANAAFGFGTGDFTVEGWFYATADNGTDFMIDFRGGVATAPAIFLYTSNQLALYYNGSIVYQPSSLTFVTNQWNHVALVRSSGVTKFYLNGVGASTTYTDNNNYPSAACIVGTDVLAGGSNYWTGYISNLRIVKGTALYTTDFTPSVTPLQVINNTSLLTCQSNRYLDNGANSFVITPVGDVKISNFQPFPGENYPRKNSMYLDTEGDHLFVTNHRAEEYKMGTGNFTVEMWVYPFYTAGTYYLATLGSETTGRYNMFIDGGAVVTNYYGTSSTRYGSAVKANAWSHIAIVRSGSSVNAYMNGILLANTETNSSAIGNGPLRIGSDGSGASTFKGYIDDVRITKGVARYTGNNTTYSSVLLTS